MGQQPGRTVSSRAHRRAMNRFHGRVRRWAASGFIGRIRLGTAGPSPRLPRWALAAVLLGVTPDVTATGSPATSVSVSSSTPSPDASTAAMKGCLRPELVALSL